MAICVETDSSNYLIATGMDTATCNTSLVISSDEYRDITEQSNSLQIQQLTDAVSAFDSSLSSFLTFDLVLFEMLLGAGALAFVSGFGAGIIIRQLSRS